MLATKLHTVMVELADRRYPIYIGAHLLTQYDLLTRHIPGSQVLIVTNETVAPDYLAQVQAACANYQCDVLMIPDGEQYKNLQVLSDIFDVLIRKGHRRNTTIIALGGGVIGDIAGFAAASYQRGVYFIQIPTTLLAQVDASVGGKTAVNHPLGKNLIGAFHQPKCVIIDILTLKTLPRRQFSAGLAEIIKYGMLADNAFFVWLEQNIEKLLALDFDTLIYAIIRSCSIKAEIVVRDERETGERALLNLGHTFAHAIESGTDYKQWLHGEAVSMGLYLAAIFSERMGYLDNISVNRVRQLLVNAGLPIEAPKFGIDRWFELMSRDKKNTDEHLRLILLKGLGEAFVSYAASRKLLAEVLG